MKFLLVAINAKYIHSNLGIYSLCRYGQKRVNDISVEIGEYTINHQMEYILKDIYIRKPDAVGFSCYIWNISYVLELVRDLKKILPDVPVWLGGPEVSYCAREILEREMDVTGIMIGEGEETFAQLLQAYEGEWKIDGTFITAEEQTAMEERIANRLGTISGLAFRLPECGRGADKLARPDGSEEMKRSSRIVVTAPRLPVALDELPFSYGDMTGFENRIIYYESSRGCPFSCSYCLSSIDKSVRFRSLSLVKKELDFFLEHKVPQVKFVDRTFNCKKDHAMAIWQYIKEHDNGITNFHFEISADLLDEEELSLLETLRPGLFQLEIGVQTVNPEAIREIRRKTDLERLKAVVARIRKRRNIHQHLDLIAGLPYEDYESFGRSFCQVYGMEPDELQLGFLKVLKGSYMAEAAENYGLKYRSCPPYEVLSTNWLSYGDVIKLKGVEEMTEVYYNSRQFIHTLKCLEQEFSSPFVMFERLAEYYEQKKLFDLKHSRIARYEILYHFIQNLKGRKASLAEYRDRLVYDLYLRENVKSRPDFASDQTVYKQVVKPEYDEYFRLHRQTDKRMVHIEVMEDKSHVLFDYEWRDPMDYNGRATVIFRESQEITEEKQG